MKSPITKVLLYVLGSVVALVCSIAIIIFVVFAVSVARTRQDIPLKTVPSPDGKWLVEIYDHSPGGDLMPSVNISIKSAVPARFFELGGVANPLIFSKENGCSLDSAFDARWTSASVLAITYPESPSDPDCKPEDDPVIVKATQWKNITIDYQNAKRVSEEQK